MVMQIGVFKDAKGEWRFNVMAGNHEIVACSEGYHNKQDALDTVKLLRDDLPYAILTVEIEK